MRLGGVGPNGIVFNSGGSLMVTDCVAQNFLFVCFIAEPRQRSAEVGMVLTSSALPLGWGVISDGGCHAYRYTTDRACNCACLLACLSTSQCARPCVCCLV